MVVEFPILSAVLSSATLIGLVWGDRRTSILEKLKHRGSGTRIRCPRCEWTPRKQDRWLCDPGCGQTWNTFDTHGCCPGCSKQWETTVCLRCHEWSRHESWYEESPE